MKPLLVVVLPFGNTTNGSLTFGLHYVGHFCAYARNILKKGLTFKVL